MALRLGTDVCTALTDYGTVLLDQRSGEYWELNPTGTIVVQTLLEGGEQGDAVDALVTEFDVERSQAVRDVTALIAQLRATGLVV
ncbi:HPr-rel-A system PqqD family protein [Streptomyces cinnamoneus]|uniref:HPr-rel-A system PqqD family protein n=1 Tax=Streptomyces cinnamoneus TaxID=53446 RepID=A0A2G1XJI6_STRCJ|nr:lasso peptide biosynthesis PqqD family chaperone [Streptomyces cinnamoneus]PHQ51412.1 HPr-rel-A system PqqD family protein [Streptomyces cinnamoneus]PPT11753.1 PqqD family protein [Streptomyces cinnamoneus]